MVSSHDIGMAIFAAGPSAPAPSDAQDVSVPVELAVRNDLALQDAMFLFAVIQSGDVRPRLAELDSLVQVELGS